MQWREHLRELEEGDSDWEEPPGSLGGDPSRGDQAGEENQQRADTDAEVFQQDRSRLEEMRDRRGSRNPSYRELALAYDVLTHEAARVAPEHQATLRSVERHREIEDIIEDVWSRTGDIVETVEAITNFLDENEVGSRRPVMGVATAGAIRGDVPEGFDNFQRNEDFSTSTTQPLPDNSFVDRTSDIRAMYLEHMEIARGEDDDAYENSQSMLMDFVADYFNEAYLRNMNAPYNDNDHESDTSFGALGAESTPRDRFVDLFMDEVGFNRLEEASVDEFYQKLEELVRDTFEEFNITPSNTPDRQDTPGRRLERTIDGDYYRDPVEYIEENEDFIFNEDDLDRIETWQDAVEFLRDRLEGIDFDYPEGNRERQNLREQLERLQRALGISDEAMLPPPMLPNSGFSQANPFV